MSLEDEISKLTAAITENTKRLDKMLGSAAAGSKAADKPADKAPADKPAGKPAAGKKATEVTSDMIAKAAGEYMKTGTTEQRDAAKANAKRICDHFGVDRLTNADPSNFAAILKMLKTFAAGEEPEELADGGEEEEDDSMI